MTTTENIGLPLYEQGESPAWLGDWNSAMQAIDANIGSGGSGETVLFAGRLTGTAQSNIWQLALPEALSSLGSTWRAILTALFQTYEKITVRGFCHFSPNPNEQQMCQPEITIYKSAFNAVAYPYQHVYNGMATCLTFNTLGGHDNELNYFRVAIDTTTDIISACQLTYDATNGSMKLRPSNETDLNYVVITAE